MVWWLCLYGLLVLLVLLLVGRLVGLWLGGGGGELLGCFVLLVYCGCYDLG